MTLKKLESMLAGGSFLALCILYTCYTVFGLVFAENLNVISVLFCIGLWLTHAAAKGAALQEKRTGLKMLSGTAFAAVILNWVLVGILAVFGIILMCCSPIFASMAENVGGFDQYIENEYYYDDGIYSSDFKLTAANDPENGFNFRFDGEDGLNLDVFGDDVNQYLEEITPDILVAVVIIVGVALLIAALCVTLVNIFFYRNLHKLTKSLATSFESGVYKLDKLNTMKNWFLVIAILSAITCLSYLSDLSAMTLLLTEGAGCASLFILFTLCRAALAAEANPQPQPEPFVFTDTASPDENVLLPDTQPDTTQDTDQE